MVIQATLTPHAGVRELRQEDCEVLRVTSLTLGSARDLVSRISRRQWQDTSYLPLASCVHGLAYTHVTPHIYIHTNK